MPPEAPTPKSQRTATISFRLLEVEKELAQAKADRLGISLTSYVRAVVRTDLGLPSVDVGDGE
jgi:hypothetical protein